MKTNWAIIVVFLFTFGLGVNLWGQSYSSDAMTKLIADIEKGINLSDEETILLREHYIVPEITKTLPDHMNVMKYYNHLSYDYYEAMSFVSETRKKIMPHIYDVKAWIIERNRLDRHYESMRNHQYDITKIQEKIIKKFAKTDIYSRLFPDVAASIENGIIRYICDSTVVSMGPDGIKELKKKQVSQNILDEAIKYATNLDLILEKNKELIIEKEEEEARLLAQRQKEEELRRQEEERKQIDQLWTIVKSNEDYSQYSNYEALMQIGSKIEAGELFYVKTTRNDITYSGWVDKEGIPNGLFYATNEDGIVFRHIYIDGKPILFGWLQNDNNHLMGLFNNELQASGDCVLLSEGKGVFVGKMNNGKREGFGSTFAYNEYRDAEFDMSQTGLFSNDVLSVCIDNLAQFEYDKYSEELLDPSIKTVSDFDYDGQKYTGGWKGGKPASYGYFLNYRQSRIELENQYRKHYCWVTYNEIGKTPFIEERFIGDVVLTYIINRLGSFRYSIKSPQSGLEYIFERNTFYEYSGFNDPSVVLSFSMYKPNPDANNRNNELISVGSHMYLRLGERVTDELEITEECGTATNTMRIYENGEFFIAKDNTILLYKADGDILELNRDQFNNNSVFYGIKYLSNGYVYVGSMNKAFQYDGEGILMFSDGEIIQQGKWNSGKLESEHTVSDYTSIIPELLSKAKSYRERPSIDLNQSFNVEFAQ